MTQALTGSLDEKQGTLEWLTSGSVFGKAAMLSGTFASTVGAAAVGFYEGVTGEKVLPGRDSLFVFAALGFVTGGYVLAERDSLDHCRFPATHLAATLVSGWISSALYLAGNYVGRQFQ